MSKVRRFCFTLNNYDAKDEAGLQGYKCDYIVYGREIAPTTGTPHLQGYIELSGSRHLSSIRKDFKWHVLMCKGSSTDNRNYCIKSGNIYERGVIKSPGKRNDLSRIVESVQQGQSMKDIILSSSNYQCIRMAEKVIQYFEPSRDWPVFVYWIYGSAGCGKTRLAKVILGKDSYTKEPGKFWNGYDGQENVLFDDFRKDNYPLDYLLRVLDRYPMIVETKGGSRQLRMRLAVITSDRPPWELWHDNDYSQVARRLGHIITPNLCAITSVP